MKDSFILFLGSFAYLLLIMWMYERWSGSIYAWVPCPGTPEESSRSSGAGVSGGCEHPMWVWELDLDVLQEQRMR